MGVSTHYEGRGAYTLAFGIQFIVLSNPCEDVLRLVLA